jgi:hypothetical protein
MITGNIYKIINNQNEDIYIGSTIQKLSERMSGHRSKYRQWKAGTYNENCKPFEMFDTVGLENCQIILIENGQFESKPHLKMREQYHIDNNVCINKLRAHISPDEICEYQKIWASNYRKKNRDIINIKGKLYRETHKEQKKKYTVSYIEKNRDEINRKRREKYALKKSSLNI